MKTGSFGSLEVFFLVAMIAGVAMIAAGLVAISLFVDLAKEKGHYRDDANILWFIGIFASPVVLGIYVMALSGKNSKESFADISKELPSL